MIVQVRRWMKIMMMMKFLIVFHDTQSKRFVIRLNQTISYQISWIFMLLKCRQCVFSLSHSYDSVHALIIWEFQIYLNCLLCRQCNVTWGNVLVINFRLFGSVWSSNWNYVCVCVGVSVYVMFFLPCGQQDTMSIYEGFFFLSLPLLRQCRHYKYINKIIVKIENHEKLCSYLCFFSSSFAETFIALVPIYSYTRLVSIQYSYTLTYTSFSPIRMYGYLLHGKVVRLLSWDTVATIEQRKQKSNMSFKAKTRQKNKKWRTKRERKKKGK